MTKYGTFRTNSSASQNDSVVIPPYLSKSALIKALNATGGNAADVIRFYPGGIAGKTTTTVAIAANADIAVLVGDAAVKNTLNGVAVAAADFIIMQLDTGGWQLMEITGVNVGANAEIDISGMTPYDAADEPSAAVAAGNVCYVVWAEDVHQIALGAASVTLTEPLLGNPGHPCAVSNDGNAAAAHYTSGTVKYIDGAIQP